ncbi:MAG: hypothetical protein ACYC7A_14850 [Thermoanaerobaculia bacterium]
MSKNSERATRIEAMKKEIESRGGIIGISPDAPEEVTELFLMEVLSCPDCMAEARRNKAAQLAPGRRRGH